ncbi:MAG TPA: hypothetical protein VIJ14_07885 [Rhabdochlamydiaceae bacterium]
MNILLLALHLGFGSMDCQPGYHCPEWAWNQYMRYKADHPEELFMRWCHVSDGYPQDGIPVLILHKGKPKVAIFDGKCDCWLFVHGSGSAASNEVYFYRFIQ